MGYDEQLFNRHPVRDEFKCPICKDVLQDPLTITGCEHVFCSSCINAWLGIRTSSNQHINWDTEHNDCPVCKTVIPNKRTELKPSLRQFKSLLNTLKLRCSFEGCQVVTTLGSFEAHLEACPENPVNVPFDCPKLCGALIRRHQPHDCITFMCEKITKQNRTIDSQNVKIEQFRKSNFTQQKQMELTQLNSQKQMEINKLLEVTLNKTKEEFHLAKQHCQSLVEENRILTGKNRDQQIQIDKLVQHISTTKISEKEHRERYQVVSEENWKLQFELKLAEDQLNAGICKLCNQNDLLASDEEDEEEEEEEESI